MLNSCSQTRAFVRTVCIVVVSMAFARSLALGLKQVTARNNFQRLTRLTMSSVKNMNVVDFGKILNSPDRGNYQIVDVREKDELLSMALPGSDVVNLPISDISSWSTQVLNGKLLDSEKPILCMCKLGGRSAKAATFFGEFKPAE
jgi:rhodanese-related sulfurtransferase